MHGFRNFLSNGSIIKHLWIRLVHRIGIVVQNCYSNSNWFGIITHMLMLRNQLEVTVTFLSLISISFTFLFR